MLYNEYSVYNKHGGTNRERWAVNEPIKDSHISQIIVFVESMQSTITCAYIFFIVQMTFKNTFRKLKKYISLPNTYVYVYTI